MNKILCFLGFHKDEGETITIEEGENYQIDKYRSVCKRCGRKTDWEYYTNLNFKIKVNNSLS